MATHEECRYARGVRHVRAAHRLNAILILVALLLPAVASAQQSRLDAAETRLTGLYASWLRTGRTDPYLQRKIAVEREKVKAIIDDELNDLANAALRTGSGTALTIADAYEREKTLVTSLQTRRDEVRVDLDLLHEEEQRAYLSTGSGSGTDTYRITRSHEELLAKRVILEERQQALAFFIGLHQDRLRKLGFQQQLQQLSAFVGIGKYFFIVLAWVALERFFRTTLFLRVRNRNRRYRLRKGFTGLMYLILGVWIVARLFTEYPGIVTSFAIVGAGVAIAMQDLIKGVIGWILIVQKRLFTLGQRISVGEHAGDVIDITLLHTTLLEVSSTLSSDSGRAARTLYVPNSYFLTRPVLNFSATSDFVEAEIAVTVSHGSDWKQAQHILTSLLEAETKEFTELARRQTVSRTQHFYLSHEAKGARVFLEMAEEGIRFVLRFPVPIGERRFVTTKLTGMILERFAAARPAIEFAKAA